MAYKGMKRPASKGAGGARKKRASGGAAIAKKCAKIALTLRHAESLPQPVRKLISDRLVHVFGTYKDDRHPFQVAISELVGATLEATKGNLETAINEAKATLENDCNMQPSLVAQNQADEQAASAAAALAAAKTGLADSHTAQKDAKTALHDLEQATKQAEADASATAAKKEKLEALVKEFFNPVKEGTLDKGLSKSAAWVGKHLGKEFGTSLEHEVIVCIVRTFSKALPDWGTFDHIIAKELDGSIKTILEGLAGELVAMENAKATRAADVQSATDAVAAAAEAVTAAEEVNKNAAQAAKDAHAAAKTAAAAVKTAGAANQKAKDVLAEAEHALSTFQAGPLAAFTEVEAHEAPPPAPEPEPAAEEAAPAAEIEAAMAPAPAPAARAAPSILPSPGVLSWVAQASGLSRSPQIAASPRAA